VISLGELYVFERDEGYFMLGIYKGLWQLQLCKSAPTIFPSRVGVNSGRLAITA
jgi:hypothetical protein